MIEGDHRVMGEDAASKRLNELVCFFGKSMLLGTDLCAISVDKERQLTTRS